MSPLTYFQTALVLAKQLWAYIKLIPEAVGTLEQAIIDTLDSYVERVEARRRAEEIYRRHQQHCDCLDKR